MRQILLRLAVALGLAVVLAGWSEGNAAGPTVRPSSRPATQVVVVAVRGMAEVRQGEGRAWERCEAGMKLGIEAEMRLGPRSAVQLEGDGRKVVVDRLGSFKVRQLMRQGEWATTQRWRRSWYQFHEGWTENDPTVQPATTGAGESATNQSGGRIRYGRTRYEIQTVGMEHESTIQAPTTTLKVRGRATTRRGR